MGAHILHDESMASQEVCEICLRPLPMCQIFLKKGRSESRGFSVNKEGSSCINLVRFRYSSGAVQCKANLPCSNVPVICPLCGAKRRRCGDIIPIPISANNIVTYYWIIFREFEKNLLEIKKMAKK